MGKIKEEKKVFMVIVVDANIIISSILKNKGENSSLILNQNLHTDFVAPEFILTEIAGKRSILLSENDIPEEKFDENLSLLVEKLFIFKDDEISESFLRWHGI